MDGGTLLAAASGGRADLVVGLLLGLCLGLLVGPAFRAWQIHREWIDASKEARLTEQLLQELDEDADVTEIPPLRSSGHAAAKASWPTRR